ncbi:hypothetical protein GGX14DRAFT_566322 [Mycena pura]|uniref:Uncharacterized protein n=1 Tax=Mycena pura TaxID=153505 RepID=A0AAD6YCI9_9AGAR|nr:hypothetical protein GGX14DRAFT_566322 [Mycena pura]
MPFILSPLNALRLALCGVSRAHAFGALPTGSRVLPLTAAYRSPTRGVVRRLARPPRRIPFQLQQPPEGRPSGQSRRLFPPNLGIYCPDSHLALDSSPAVVHANGDDH